MPPREHAYHELVDLDALRRSFDGVRDDLVRSLVLGVAAIESRRVDLESRLSDATAPGVSAGDALLMRESFDLMLTSLTAGLHHALLARLSTESRKVLVDDVYEALK